VTQQEIDSLVPARGPYTRRDVMRSAVGTGFAAAVLPVMAQTVIKTDSTGLTAGEVTFLSVTSRCRPIAQRRPVPPGCRWCW
jgi:carboxymethylenebutenolidase